MPRGSLPTCTKNLVERLLVRNEGKINQRDKPGSGNDVILGIPCSSSTFDVVPIAIHGTNTSQVVPHVEERHICNGRTLLDADFPVKEVNPILALVSLLRRRFCSRRRICSLLRRRICGRKRKTLAFHRIYDLPMLMSTILCSSASKTLDAKNLCWRAGVVCMCESKRNEPVQRSACI